MRVLPSHSRSFQLAFLLGLLLPNDIQSFHHPRGSLTRPLTAPSSSTALYGLKKGGKFNKQKDLAAKMEEAKRQREQAEGGTAPAAATSAVEDGLSSEEIKLRNDRQRFQDLLENSMIRTDDDGMGLGSYLTVEQEEENADAVYRGVARLYEGDPAPSTPFAELLDIQTEEPLGKSGVSRLIPWENSSKANDYVVVITDPRPKSVELRSAMKKLCSGAVAEEIVKRCVIIDTDTPGENRRFLKKNFAEGSMVEGLTVLVDENLEWMREYTALGEKRFSMTMFVLSDGRCQKIAREVDADLICNAVTNAVRAMKSNN
eukprot:CCRYP_012432-RA/>CCRYP_012432-RA protein AED:0.08 eAED:0.08 QI:286/1/1/1/1/1/3/86/315